MLTIFKLLVSHRTYLQYFGSTNPLTFGSTFDSMFRSIFGSLFLQHLVPFVSNNWLEFSSKNWFPTFVPPIFLHLALIFFYSWYHFSSMTHFSSNNWFHCSFYVRPTFLPNFVPFFLHFAPMFYYHEVF